MKCRRCSAPLDAEKAQALRALGVPWWNLCGPCAEAENGGAPAGETTTSPAAFARHLRAAHGYLELGLPHVAWDELEEIEPPARRAEVPVLSLRVAIYHALERWGPMAEVCRHLATVEPGETCWPLSLAYAVRRAEGIPAARDILLRAMVRFPEEATISFNLACYAAQGGRPEERPGLPPACFRVGRGAAAKGARGLGPRARLGERRRDFEQMF